MLDFGNTLFKTCEFDLSTLTSTNIYDHPETANIFYELYLQDYDGALVDIPVLIRNFYDSNGAQPNDASQTDETKWRLVRRFFMFDSISGVEGTANYDAGVVSSVIRYPLTVTLQINLDPNNPEMIYPPLLIIEYRERSTTTIVTDSLATVTFTSEYAMDTTNFWKVTKIVFIIINIFTLLLLVG